MTSSTYYLLAACGSGATALVLPTLRWAVTRIRRKAQSEVIEQMKDHFIQEVAENHLPHLYHVLELICDKLEIPVTEPPAIKFIHIEGPLGTDSSSHSGRS